MITAVVAVRAGSQRVKNKNIRPFGNTNLLEMKLQLLKEVKELGYKGTGVKYGVSDNAIRKWVKIKYDI